LLLLPLLAHQFSLHALCYSKPHEQSAGVQTAAVRVEACMEATVSTTLQNGGSLSAATRRVASALQEQYIHTHGNV
jgi:hypothetical protein